MYVYKIKIETNKYENQKSVRIKLTQYIADFNERMLSKERSHSEGI